MSRQFVTKQERRNMESQRSNRVAEPVHIGTKPRVMRLNINLIKMADYQRKPSDAVVKKMIAEYDPDRDRPVELSYRDGAYWCFDGQHRTQAHKLMRNDTILAQVHFGLTYEQEAALFAKQHENERKVSTRDLWSAAVKAGKEYPEVQKIISICEKEGFVVQAHSDPHPNIISCLRVIQQMFNKHGEQGLKDVLFVIKTAWPNMPRNTHNEVFAGLLKMMDCYKMGDTEWNRLRDKLATITPDKFLMKANTHVGRGGKGVAKLMVDMYNKNLRSEKSRLDPYRIK